MVRKSSRERLPLGFSRFMSLSFVARRVRWAQYDGETIATSPAAWNVGLAVRSVAPERLAVVQWPAGGLAAVCHAVQHLFTLPHSPPFLRRLPSLTRLPDPTCLSFLPSTNVWAPWDCSRRARYSQLFCTPRIPWAPYSG